MGLMVIKHTTSFIMLQRNQWFRLLHVNIYGFYSWCACKIVKARNHKKWMVAIVTGMSNYTAIKI